MFVHHCSACDRRQLIFPSQITGAATQDGESGLAFTCWCGSEQIWLLERKVSAAHVAAA
ncbi:hypothetical protein NODU109028_00620 [Nocardioides dubius]|uniref:Uncharacterized protein n=1 Tax=Nocardioides dubius TaxID=317019 RepID=A0ABP4EIE0_9ACTN